MIDWEATIVAWVNMTASVSALFGDRVFTDRVPPGFDIADPVLVIAAPVAQSRQDTSTALIRAATIDLRIYAQVEQNDERDTLLLVTAAETLAFELHRSRPALVALGNTSLTCGGVQVDGPVSAPTESPSLGGRRLSTRWTFKEA